MYDSYIHKRVRRPFWVCVLFILAFTNNAYAQNEWALNKYPGDDVRLLAETYDGGMIVQVLSWQFNSPVILAKYSMDGKIIWGKTLTNNIRDVQAFTVTQDSGFIIGILAFSAPVNAGNWDSLGIIELMKFDKCARLQWARYVKSVFVDLSPQPTSVIENNGDFYLCCLGINGYDDYDYKPVTILKFNQGGVLLGYRSYNGHNAMLYQNPNQDTIYFSQDMGVPIGNNTTVSYLFSGIHSIDTSLNTIDSVVVGYYERILNGMGSLVIKTNSVQAISDGRFLSNGIQEPMFSEWNKSLSQIGGFSYDSIPHYAILFPAYSSFHNDSLIVCNQVVNDLNDTFFTSLRLYDKNYHKLKEAVITKLNNPLNAQTTSFLALKNGDFIVGELFTNPYLPPWDSTIIGTSFYLYDKSLNPIPWPTTPPAKGNDWACNTTILDSEVINVDSVVTPVYVQVDTSIVNWHALGIPENAVTGKIENGWLVWPQPMTSGSALYLQSQSNNAMLNFNMLDVIFYDMQGKQVLETTAMFQSANKWVIPSLNLPCAGVYMAELRNKRSGASLGTIKVVVD